MMFCGIIDMGKWRKWQTLGVNTSEPLRIWQLLDYLLGYDRLRESARVPKLRQNQMLVRVQPCPLRFDNSLDPASEPPQTE